MFFEDVLITNVFKQLDSFESVSSVPEWGLGFVIIMAIALVEFGLGMPFGVPGISELP